MVKNIIFDLGNVLFHLNFSATFRYLKAHVSAEKDVEHIFQEVIRGKEFDLFNRGKITRQEFFRYVRQFLDKVIDEEDFWRGYSDIFIPNRRLIQTIPSLKEHFHLFILSNTDVAHMEYLFHKYPHFFKLFNDAVYSYEAGAMKPERQIFKFLLHKTGITASSSLFIDDLSHNIEVAQEMGFRTFHFSNNTDELLHYIEELKNPAGKQH